MEVRPWPHFRGQDPKFVPYVKEYKGLARESGIELNRDPSIGFEALGSDAIVGSCYRSIGYREIVLDQANWDRATSTTRRMLAFHELTHCYCARSHDSRQMNDGCPASLMSRVIPTDDCATLHGENYEKEMFSHCRPYK